MRLLWAPLPCLLILLLKTQSLLVLLLSCSGSSRRQGSRSRLALRVI